MLIFSTFIALTFEFSVVSQLLISLWFSVCRCSYSDIPDNEFTVKGLQEGKEYEFRVAAVNKAGVGDFAETDKAIRAQPPPVAPKVSPDFIPRDIVAKKGQPFKIAIPYRGNPIPTTSWTLVRKFFLSGTNFYEKL